MHFQLCYFFFTLSHVWKDWCSMADSYGAEIKWFLIKIAEPTLGSSLFPLYWKTVHSPGQASIKEIINAVCHHLSEYLVLFSIIKLQEGLCITPRQCVPSCLVCAALLNTGPNAAREFSTRGPGTGTWGDYNSSGKVKVSLGCYRGGANPSLQSFHHKPLIPILHCIAEGRLKWMELSIPCVSALFEATQSSHCLISLALPVTKGYSILWNQMECVWTAGLTS